MLPLEIERRIENPGLLENQFLEYLIAGNFPIDASKSIGYEVLTDYRNVSARTNAQFFTGAFVQSQTNIRGGYVRPQGEHFVFYGIRIYYTTYSGTFDPEFVTWRKASYQEINFVDGAIQNPFANCTYSIINNGVVELKNMPFLMHDNSLVTDDRGTLFLNQPITWAGQTEMRLECRTNSPNNPFGGDGAEQNVLLRFDLVGIGLI